MGKVILTRNVFHRVTEPAWSSRGNVYALQQSAYGNIYWNPGYIVIIRVVTLWSL